MTLSKMPHALPKSDPRFLMNETDEAASRAALIVPLIEWIGRNRRVLSLGPCAGDLRKRLERNGCCIEVMPIAPERDSLALRPFAELETTDASVSDNRYDAILAVDVLCRVPDPRQLLESLKDKLAPHGAVFLMVANATHASHRLAMVRGEIPLEWQTHEEMRCWTYASVVDLLDEAGFALGGIEREQGGLNAHELDEETRPLAERWTSEIDASTVRFLMAAYPLPAAGMDWLHRRMRFLSERAEAAERTAREVRHDLEMVQCQLGELLHCHDALGQRELELGQLCTQAQINLAERDTELQETTARYEEKLRDVTARLTANEQCLADVRAHRDELTERFARIRSSLPGKIYQGLKKFIRRD